MKWEQVVFELTSACNLKCHFCYNVWKAKGYKKRKELTLGEYKKIIQKLPPARIYGLSGGEPLLRKDILEIIDMMKSAGKCDSIALITSGVHLTPQLAKKLSERNVKVQLSIHGVGKKHDEITGRKGCFKSLIKAFIYLRENDIAYSTSTVIDKSNLKDLKETLEFSAAIGSRYLLLNRFLPGGRGMKEKELMLNRKEVKSAYMVLNQVCGYYGVRGGVGVPNLPCIIKEKQFKHLDFSACGAGKSWFVIGPSGDVRICNHSPAIYGNLLKEKLEDILENSTFQQFKADKIFPKECKQCPVVKNCRGGCRAGAETLYGSLYAPDPLFNS